MSEIQKNIETCRGEDVLAEVSGLPQDPHFGSLVNEALDPLKQQAAAQEGWDGYSEVIEQHKPYTFASFIAQMKSNLLLLLRALWQFPFGSGTLRSLADDASLRSLSDMWQHYITRLSGNETYGIPSRLSSLTDLPSAPLLVEDRKISGVPEAVDGISLVQLLANSTANTTIKELTDSTTGWELSTFDKIKSAFPSLERMQLNCTGVIWDGKQIKGWQSLKIVDAPNITELRRPRGDNGAIINNPALEQVLLPGTTVAHCAWSDGPCIYQCTNMWKLVLGTLTEMRYVVWEDSVNLIHIEIGADTAISMDWGRWSPTNALDASLDTLVTDEDCHNNLEQFLKNFRTYICQRLADRTGQSKLTLTLSAAVYTAIMADDDIKAELVARNWKVTDGTNNYNN